MMKMHSVVTSVAAVVLGVPAVLAGQGDIDTLKAALASTDNSLGALEVLLAELKGENPPTSTAVLEVTEAPTLDAPQRDARLEELRNQVSFLTTQYDEMEAAASPAIQLANASNRVTTGFDDDMRRALNLPHASTPTPTTARVAPTETAPITGDSETTTEAETSQVAYSAHPMKQAQALFNAKRFEDAIAVLKPLGKDPEALYWHGRSLEKLKRYDEALKTLGDAKAASEDPLLTRRIETDIEFTTWLKSFSGAKK